MSRTSDLRIDLMNLEQTWIEFLADLFERDGWEVLAKDVSTASRGEPDVSIMQRGSHVLVELKLIRSGLASRALLHNATSNLLAMMKARNAERGILIIPQRITAEARRAFADVSGERIELWDLDVLVQHVTRFPNLSRRFADLLRALQIGAESAPSNATTVAMLDDAGQELPPPGEGARIASALKAIEPGKKGGAAQSFEKLCEEALILLFGTELLGWRRQSAIENGYQRVDLIARLQPVRSAFWTTLSADFRARYIVFEFKNYTDPIGQDQIYATERYLYATALRSVAIVIARNGYSENAGRTVRGALRDQGKLILCLDLEEFCSMLQAFDTGDEFEKPLFAKRDDLLMSLAR